MTGQSMEVFHKLYDHSRSGLYPISVRSNGKYPTMPHLMAPAAECVVWMVVAG